MLDILVRGGLVIDGGPDAVPRQAEVAIEGDRIVDVGRLPAANARRIVDADGAFVCPGLIDPHSHSDSSVLANPTAESTIRQGVTTEIVGNCGMTYAPLSDASAAAVAVELAGFGYEEPVRWRTFGELIDVVAAGGTSQNLAWFVGHSAIRDAAGIGPRTVAPADLDTMTALVAEAMDAGALGMSTGLEYGSGRSASTPELVSLARSVGGRGGMYASHIRNRDADLAAAVTEFFSIARAGGGRTQLSHLNVRYGTGAPEGGWQDAVELLAAERERGLPVLADITPFVEGDGIAVGLLPDWFLAGGLARAAALLSDESVRDRLRADCDRYWRFVHRGGWDRVALESGPGTPEWDGLSIPEIARRTGRDEWDCFFDILAAAGPVMGAVRLRARLFTEKHVAEAVAHPLFCLGVDAFTSRVDGPIADRTRHPLYFAGHAHYLAHHVRDTGTLDLPTAIHKMTGMVAEQFGLTGRGRIRRGHHADLIVFDLDNIAERSTVTRPHAYATGVDHVFVNGVAVIDSGEHTGARPGRYLPRS